MPVQKISADELVKCCLKVFWKHGYHQTSMSNLAQACGLQKGSLYHHFPKGKEQIMQAVLALLHKGYQNNLFSIAYNDALCTQEKLKLFKEFSYKTFFDASDGCLMGNIALETVSLNPDFAQYFRHFFSDWIAALTNVFKTQYSEQQAILHAKDAVAQVEGAVMLMKVFQDKSYLERAFDKILEKFDFAQPQNTKNLETSTLEAPHF